MRQTETALLKQNVLTRLSGITTVLPGNDKPWGQAPALSLLSALGLLLAAFANNAARNSAVGADLLFWTAMLILFVPITVRLLSHQANCQERLALVVLAGLGFYLVKVLHSPTYFTFFDEFSHWRTALDITRTHHLFAENAVLPISALYPGLEIVTTAFANLSGLSIYEAGLIVIGVGRLLFMLALFLVFERISRSTRIASLAVMLYMANSNFVFFDSQFAYESLSLPLAMFVLLAIIRQQSAQDSNATRLLIPIIVGVSALSITHHLTAYMLAAFLGLWTVVRVIRNHRDRQWLELGLIALWTLGVSIEWAQLVGNATGGYLAPVLQGGMSDLMAVMRNEVASRELFKSASGYVAPLWERLNGLGAVGLILLGLPVGLYYIWLRFRKNVLALTLACAVLGYPLGLVFRLTPHGWEISNRTSEFVFVAIGFVLAVAAVGFTWARRSQRLSTFAVVAWMTAIFTGGIIAGWPPWARLPGSYLVSADTRSVEDQGIAMAIWTKTHLGTDNRIGTDRINRILTLTYGGQHPVTTLHGKIDTAPIFYAPQIGEAEQKLIRDLNIRYLIVDRRLALALPAVGVYFETDNPESPIPLAVLEKFDGLSSMNRIFDSGDIAIYDVSKLHVQ